MPTEEQLYAAGCRAVAAAHVDSVRGDIVESAIAQDALDLLSIANKNPDSTRRGRKPFRLPNYHDLARCTVPPIVLVTDASDDVTWVKRYPLVIEGTNYVLSAWFVLLGSQMFKLLEQTSLQITHEMVKHREYVRQRIRAISTSRMAGQKRQMTDEDAKVAVPEPAGPMSPMPMGPMPVSRSVWEDPSYQSILSDLREGSKTLTECFEEFDEEMSAIDMVEVTLDERKATSGVYQSPKRRRSSASSLRVIVPSGQVPPLAVLSGKSLFVPSLPSLP